MALHADKVLNETTLTNAPRHQRDHAPAMIAAMARLAQIPACFSSLPGPDSHSAGALDRLVPLSELMARTTWSRASIYRKIRDGTLMAPIKIGDNRIAWWDSEITAYLASLPRSVRRPA